MIAEGGVEIAGATAVKRVDDELAFGFAEDVEANQFFAALEVSVAEVDGFPFAVFAGVSGAGARSPRDRAIFLDQFRDPGFDVFGDFGESGAVVGRRTFL